MLQEINKRYKITENSSTQQSSEENIIPCNYFDDSIGEYLRDENDSFSCYMKLEKGQVVENVREESTVFQTTISL